ncbi:MAG: hypothetical protein KA010_00240 [Saprospiraceae bacterium]|nr:hypothetical protein [Saprospiraceae bacterium]
MLTKLNFTIFIEASPEKVWHSLWDIENYKQWTSVFSEGSYYEVDNFTEGNKIHLLTPKGDGMYSILEKIIVNKQLSFKHIGDIIDFKEVPVNAAESVENWSGAYETYTLNAKNGGTELSVSVDTLDKYIDFMNSTFPKALSALKEIAEL